MGIEIRTVQDGKAEEIHIGVKGLVGALYLKDLAQKTKRGQAGVVRDGRHNGGRSYGYRPIAGQNGKLEIVEDEAAVVRRIFEAYIARKVAAGYCRWPEQRRNSRTKRRTVERSTIAGSRKRANGILQNALYVGRISWNWQSFIKDPETGRRISRPNPKSEWMTADVPELRIIADELFHNVQKRRAERAGALNATMPADRADCCPVYSSVVVAGLVTSSQAPTSAVPISVALEWSKPAYAETAAR